jgi:pyruvate kinase
MYPGEGIRSQLEWNSALSTSNVPLSTDQSKYHRKVGYLLSLNSFQG